MTTKLRSVEACGSRSATLASSATATNHPDGLPASVRNFRLGQLRQQREGFLTPEIAVFYRNDIGNAFLHHLQIGAAENLRQGHRSYHLAGKIRVVEYIGIAQPLAGLQLEVGAPEGVAFAG